jgi:hypothetical protein
MMFVVLTLVMVATAMAGGLALTSHAERQIAATHRGAVQLGYASESATARLVLAVEAQLDWRTAPGAFVGGPVTSTPELQARTAALNDTLASRFPFGADTPVWRVVATMVDGDAKSVVWIADDPADRDGDASQDSNGRLMVRSESRTAAGGVRGVEVYLARDEAGTRCLSWQEVW